MSIPCSWVSTLLSSWPGARATGQGPMASNGCVADRLMSPHTRHQTERFSPTGTEGERAPTQEPSSDFSLSVQVSLVYARQCVQYTTLWFLGCSALGHVLRASGSFGTSVVMCKPIICYFAAIPCRICYERNSMFIPHVRNFAVLVPGCRSDIFLVPSHVPRACRRRDGVWTSSPMICRMFSSGTGFPKDMNYRRHGVSRRGAVQIEIGIIADVWRNLVDGAVRGASPGRTAAGTQFQSPTQIDRDVGGWACARVLRFGATPVGRSYPMIRRAGGVCKADAQELSDDRRA